RQNGLLGHVGPLLGGSYAVVGEYLALAHAKIRFKRQAGDSAAHRLVVAKALPGARGVGGGNIEVVARKQPHLGVIKRGVVGGVGVEVGIAAVVRDIGRKHGQRRQGRGQVAAAVVVVHPARVGHALIIEKAEQLLRVAAGPHVGPGVHLKRAAAQGIGLVYSRIKRAAINPGVVGEQGVAHASGAILHKGCVGSVERVLVGHGAGRNQGIVPVHFHGGRLDDLQALEQVAQLGYFGGGHGRFGVEKPAVEAVVIGHIYQLLGP
nr:hypothetical protein [Tanacetum cinerariifolium]